MFSQHVPFTSGILTLGLLVLIGGCVAHAQEPVAVTQERESDEAIINQADEYLRLWQRRREVDFAFRVDLLLKDLLRRHPDSPQRQQAEERLVTVGEPLGEHNLVLALYYLKRFEEGKAPHAKGAELRLRHILCEYPKFTRMDEVLGHLRLVSSLTGDTKVAGYLQRLIDQLPGKRNYVEACAEIRRLGGEVRP